MAILMGAFILIISRWIGIAIGLKDQKYDLTSYSVEPLAESTFVFFVLVAGCLKPYFQASSGATQRG